MKKYAKELQVGDRVTDVDNSSGFTGVVFEVAEIKKKEKIISFKNLSSVDGGYSPNPKNGLFEFYLDSQTQWILL